MQKTTLSWRLGLAFGALILLMSVLGGLAVGRMSLATSSATDVSTKHVPVVDIASNVNTTAWETRYSMRNYALTGDPEWLRSGRKMLAQVYTWLTEADNLVRKYPDLVALSQGAIEARKKTAEFETAVDAMETEYKKLAEVDIALDAAAKIFVDQCAKLRDSQRQSANDEVDARVAPAALKERIMKLGTIDELIDIGNGIQIKNFKAQTARDMDALRTVLKDFDTLDKAMASLRPLIRTQANIQQMDSIEEAANSYKTGMEQLLKSRLSVEEHANALFTAGEAVTNTAAAVADGGLKTIEAKAADVANGLSLTSLILIIGLVIALIAGVLIAWLSTRAITRPIREGVNTLAATASQISTTVSQLASNASETAAALWINSRRETRLRFMFLLEISMLFPDIEFPTGHHYTHGRPLGPVPHRSRPALDRQSAPPSRDREWC